MKKLTILFISFVILLGVCHAQWEHTSCPVAYTSALIVSGTNIFAGTTSGVFLSSDNGISWTAVNNGLTSWNLTDLAVIGTNLFAGTWGGGVFLSTNNGTSWSVVNNGLTNTSVWCLGVSDLNLFAGTHYGGGVFLSTNNGTSWTAVNSGLSTSYPVTALTKNGSYIFAGTEGDGVFRSSDNGSNWTVVNSGLGEWEVTSLLANETDIFAGGFWGSVSLSTNHGDSWTVVSNGLSQTGEIFALEVSGTHIFAGTSFKGVFLSTDNGSLWTAVNSGLPVFPVPPVPNHFDIRSLVADDIYLYAGTVQHGVWRRSLSEIVPVELISFTATTSEGIVELNWITSTETNNQGFEILRSAQNDSESWERIGFVEGHGTTTESQAYSFTDKNVVPGKYKYRLKQVDFDGTFEYSNEVEVQVTSPTTFTLEQNYPNPFNPSTTIKYSIPTSEIVTLKVYDVLGKEVVALVNEEKSEGIYTVEFDASYLPSGTYFYQIKASSFIETKKMLLMK